jgi:hypothetical protein
MRAQITGVMACAVLAGSAGAQCPATVLWGDATADGSVNIIDAQQVARSSVGLSASNVAAVAFTGDVTADGNVNIIDAQQIARHSVGLPAAARLGTSHTIPADPGQCAAAAWPGGSAIQTVAGMSVFGTNMSGLAYEGSGSATPGVLWAVRNGPGTMHRLVWDGTMWVRDAGNGWSAGKTLRYPGGAGDPDAEGVTFTSASSGGMYVATERNNSVSGTSRNAILRFDVSGSATTIEAVNEWNLTADLPAVGANTGIEAITWVPDAYLVARGFFDESKGRTYVPADYPDHGSGIFFVGVEANGVVYGYALDHTGNTFTRVATVPTGFAGVMALEFDRELNTLWAVCDNTCNGQSAVLEVGGTGRFHVIRLFDRPAGMANLNNEGFAFAAHLECVSNRKPSFWADDDQTNGHAIRGGTVPCTSLAPAPPAVARRK